MKIISFIKKYVAVIVLIVALIAFLKPVTFSWIQPSVINYLLGFVMLCMGIALKPNDFKVVFMQPKSIIIGCLSQFVIMPVIAWLLTKIFNLPEELAIGVILVGCCPGGTASNIMTYLAKGDLALSVGMTSVSTVLAPILTPLIFWFFAGTFVEVDVMNMFLSIVKVVILPIIIGLCIQHFFQKFATASAEVLPAISALFVALIVGIVVSANATKLLDVGILVFVVVVLHNLCGILLGYLVGRGMKLSHKQCVAISIEVGMQNSGLACSLAQQHFSSMLAATVPGAVFSVWHNLSGAVFARIYSSMDENKAK